MSDSVDKASLEPAEARCQSEDSAEFERTAAAVILKTCGYWMLRTFVPGSMANGGVPKVSFSTIFRSA